MGDTKISYDEQFGIRTFKREICSELGESFWLELTDSLGMLLELIVLLIIGIILLIVGWSIWKREKINLIHDYHYKNVAEADKKEYTALMGKGAIIIGIGIILTGIIDFITQTGWGWTAFGVCFVSGFGLMVYAGMKYN